VGKEGVERIVEARLEAEEQEQLERSAQVLRRILGGVNL
jgi:malate/lactate dehydrogenase